MHSLIQNNLKSRFCIHLDTLKPDFRSYPGRSHNHIYVTQMGFLCFDLALVSSMVSFSPEQKCFHSTPI